MVDALPVLFQFTPLREGRRSSRGGTGAVRLFQFTPLREGRRTAAAKWKACRRFQFTPLREGRRSLFTSAAVICYFNSRPSARGDQRPHNALVNGIISIHAPPRGATLRVFSHSSICSFQFTPLREGRPYASREAAAAIEFQFTPLREGHFNSRPSARGDVLAILGIVTDPTFQFTPLREGRQQAELLAMHGIEFQFTPLREGRPLPQACHAAQRTISIHAPPRGATARVIGAPRLALISIHAPPRGATRLNFLKSS